MGWGSVWVALVALVLGGLGCDPTATGDAWPDAKAQSVETGVSVESEARAPAVTEGLLIGELPLAEKPVVDGDTIRVVGFDRTIRLLGIDTEELLHGDAERAAVKKDFTAYLKRKRGNAPRPITTGTPMGEEAKAFAEAFFAGAETVRLERDDPKTLRGGYGRALAYAFVEKDGRWTSYNIECVRAGMSPYFTKYGYSQRFHNQFSRAEAEARLAQRGIWSPRARGYGDYEERKAWWNARADFLRAFAEEANGRANFIDLAHWDAPEELERHIGREVTVLSTIREIKGFKRLVRVRLSMAGEQRFPIIFFDRGVFQATGIAAFQGEPVLVRGNVQRYEKGDYQTLQIVVDDAAQVTLPTLPTRN